MKKFLISILVSFPISAYADVHYSTYYHKCMDESKGITSEMLNCISIETQYQDDRLNKIYKKLQQQLAQNEKLKLRDEQRTWIKTRDNKVNKIYKTQGGSMADINGQSLYLELTIKQADKLERRIK
ncbi:lysozyme inhibitor LprI family protein [Acinetobacter brisouii]